MAAGLESGAGAGAPDGGGGYAPGTGVGMEEYDAEMGMAPVDMDQAMGSFSPEWGNNTVGNAKQKTKNERSESLWLSIVSRAGGGGADLKA